jgi:hypothetical protein
VESKAAAPSAGVGVGGFAVVVVFFFFFGFGCVFLGADFFSLAAERLVARPAELRRDDAGAGAGASAAAAATLADGRRSRRVPEMMLDGSTSRVVVVSQDMSVSWFART